MIDTDRPIVINHFHQGKIILSTDSSLESKYVRKQPPIVTIDDNEAQTTNVEYVETEIVMDDVSVVDCQSVIVEQTQTTGYPFLPQTSEVEQSIAEVVNNNIYAHSYKGPEIVSIRKCTPQSFSSSVASGLTLNSTREQKPTESPDVFADIDDSNIDITGLEVRKLFC